MNAATTMTTAQHISALYGDNGQSWTREFAGREFTLDEDVADTAETHRERNGAAKYRFADGSAIIVTQEGWDLALEPADDECYCWAGEPQHAPSCPRNEQP